MTELVQEELQSNPSVQASPTPEEVERSFNAAMDSVNLLNAGKPEEMTDEDWADTVKRNKEHLSIQLNKEGFYAGYDLTPFEQAIAA